MELITLENLFMLFFGAIIIDFVTGVLVAGKQGKLKSRACSNGIFRTMGEVIVLTIFLCIDYLIPDISAMLSTFVIGFLFKAQFKISIALLKITSLFIFISLRLCNKMFDFKFYVIT